MRAKLKGYHMTTMNISVPDPMKDWDQTQIAEGKYASSSDYVRDLIRRDQLEKDKFTALQSAITLGIESSEAGTLDIEDIKRKTREWAELKTD